MNYVSTRGQAPVLDFREAMLAGLAEDGGLYAPDAWPSITAAEIAALRGLSFEDAAFDIIRRFTGDAFTDEALKGAVDRAYTTFAHPARCPLVQTGANDWIMELHHGPTLAFKDVAMQLIGQLFDIALTEAGRRVTIVGATSGDTGSAAIEAFKGKAAADVFILYPHGRVSEVQRRQMTTPTEANVHALAVEGDFDDCQALVKAMFADIPFRDRVGLAAVNSINWARVLAQTVYYFTAAVALGAPDRAISFTVPTGNFGDIYAGYGAKRMGLPIDRLVVATNRNDILHRTIATGAHVKDGVAPTISPSMDIQVSSNFERLLFEVYDREGPAIAGLMDDLRTKGGFTLAQGALERIRADFDSGRADEAETTAEIRRLHAAQGYVLDPHTAVGTRVAAAARGDRATPMVTLGTAHAAKFPDAVEAAIGLRPPLPPHMADLYDRSERVQVVANDLAAIQTLIEQDRRA